MLVVRRGRIGVLYFGGVTLPTGPALEDRKRGDCFSEPFGHIA